MRPMLQSAKDLGPVEETAERGWVAADADTTTSDAVPPLPPVRTSESAQMQARLMIVGQQLDAFWPRGVLLERYQMLGNGDRCQGGAGPSAWSSACASCSRRYHIMSSVSYHVLCEGRV